MIKQGKEQKQTPMERLYQITLNNQKERIANLSLDVDLAHSQIEMLRNDLSQTLEKVTALEEENKKLKNKSNKKKKEVSTDEGESN